MREATTFPYHNNHTKVRCCSKIVDCYWMSVHALGLKLIFLSNKYVLELTKRNYLKYYFLIVNDHLACVWLAKIPKKREGVK